jgi:dihydroxyacetone kinase-like protein
MEVTTDTIRRWVEAYARDVEQNKDYLTELDGAIGDHDHGVNMDRGFRSVMGSLPAENDASVDSLLKSVGMALIRTVGGAAGPLYGTVFLRMAQATTGKGVLNEQELGEMLEAGRKGIVDRGKAQPGDKTMLDAWEPAVRAYEEARSSGKGLQEAVGLAAQAAEQGMKDTVPLVARKGRASYLGERSAGHQDPGATSSYLLFKDLKEVVSSEP